jgi:hypothetical protein
LGHLGTDNTGATPRRFRYKVDSASFLGISLDILTHSITEVKWPPRKYESIIAEVVFEVLMVVIKQSALFWVEPG